MRACEVLPPYLYMGGCLQHKQFGAVFVIQHQAVDGQALICTTNTVGTSRHMYSARGGEWLLEQASRQAGLAMY